MTEWGVAAFGDLYAVPSKSGIMAPSRVRGAGVRLVNMKEIFAYDRISAQAMERAPIPSRKPEDWLLKPGDLLFARQSLTRAGAGKVSIVEETREPITFESHIIRIRLDGARALGQFYYYLFRSSIGRDLVESIVEQVAAAGIRASDLARLPVPVPPLDEQRRIAGVLGALDDLIETNRQQISRLRDVARAYFESAAGDGDEVSFGDVAQLVRQGVSRDALSAGTPYLGLEHFGTDGAGITGVGDAGTVDSNKSRFTEGDVLYGKLRPYFRKYDRPGFSGVCSTEIWVLRGAEPYGSATVSALVARPDFTEFAMQGSGGTRMPRADWNHVASMPVAVPAREQLDKVEPHLDALWRAGVDLQNEVTVLTRARDELLPLLMSGRVRVREVA